MRLPRTLQLPSIQVHEGFCTDVIFLLPTSKNVVTHCFFLFCCKLIRLNLTLNNSVTSELTHSIFHSFLFCLFLF